MKQSEPTEQEMLSFSSLLKENNAEAKRALDLYSQTQDKIQFYSQIIGLCRRTAPEKKSTDTSKSFEQKHHAEVPPTAPKEPRRGVCFKFRQGTCNRGSSCRFEHTAEQPPASVSSTTDTETKTQPMQSVKSEVLSSGESKACQFYLTNGTCRKGDKCKFVHPGSVREGQNWVDIARRPVSGVVSVVSKERPSVDNSTASDSVAEVAAPVSASAPEDVKANEARAKKLKAKKKSKSENKKSRDASSTSEPSPKQLEVTIGRSTDQESQATGSSSVDQEDSLWMTLNLAKLSTPSPVLSGVDSAESEKRNMTADEVVAPALPPGIPIETSPRSPAIIDRTQPQPQVKDLTPLNGQRTEASESTTVSSGSNARSEPPVPPFMGMGCPPPYMMGMYPPHPHHPMAMQPPYGPMPYGYFPPPPQHQLSDRPVGERERSGGSEQGDGEGRGPNPPYPYPYMGFPYPPYGLPPFMPPYREPPYPMPQHMMPPYMQQNRPQNDSPKPEDTRLPQPLPTPTVSANAPESNPSAVVTPVQTQEQSPTDEEALLKRLEQLSPARVLGGSSTESPSIYSHSPVDPQPQSIASVGQRGAGVIGPGPATAPTVSSEDGNRPQMPSPSHGKVVGLQRKDEDGGKSSALLSFLKSKGSTVHTPMQPAPPQDTQPRGPPAGNIGKQTQANVQVEPPSSTKEDDKLLQVKKAHRTTRNQRGRVRICINPSRRDPDSYYDMPVDGLASGPVLAIDTGKQIMVTWEIPAEQYSEGLVVSLTRLGSMNNSNCIVSKALRNSLRRGEHEVRISPESPLSRGLVGEDVLHMVKFGDINFHTPKAGGHYVFRMFDPTSEEANVTLGTSPEFVVQLRGSDVNTNLKYACEALKKAKIDVGSVTALRSTFELMAAEGLTHDKRSPHQLLQQCVQLLLDAVQKNMDALSERDKALIQQPVEKEDGNNGGMDGVDKAESTVWTKARNAQRIHAAVYDCLVELRDNKIPWSMLTPAQKETVLSVMSLFCPILRRFFNHGTELEAARQMDLGFNPSPPMQTKFAARAISHLNDTIASRLREFLPSRDFYEIREAVRCRLQEILHRGGVIPRSACVEVFGSSRNNFGSDGADLDMCLQYIPGSHVPAGDDRVKVMDHLGEVLIAARMEDVEVRSTARIPIVLFKDPSSGLACDISFSNPLAIQNTLLLAAYSMVDPRVREIAYVVKHWAKQRRINSPQEGTLSSYGYILCIIHFLQTRSPPLLPNLQKLHPSWHPRAPYDPSPLPKRWYKHPVDDCYCNTYFFDVAPFPSAQQPGGPAPLQKLQAWSACNGQSSGELIVEFFRYFAYEFDYHSDVVSVRRGGLGRVKKIAKMEADGWGSHDRISIEDPFETWYDVAHVVKGAQMSYIRREFLRAYTMICRSQPDGSNHEQVDCLPTSPSVSGLFDLLCEEAEEPKFVTKRQEARSRSNTLASDACN